MAVRNKDELELAKLRNGRENKYSTSWEGLGWSICGPKRPMWLERTQLESMVPDEAEETGCNSARDFFFF